MNTINTSGRRKTAVARIYMKAGNGNITVNGRDYKEYFPTGTLQYIVNQAFVVSKEDNKFDVNARLNGGGMTGQAEALRLAISKHFAKSTPNTDMH